MNLLEVKNLSINFISEGIELPAVSDLSFEVKTGEILAIVGESGCGKSVTCLSLSRLVPQPPGIYSSGEIIYKGGKGDIDVLKLTIAHLREFRRHCISYIFQEPSVSLNPVFKIGDQIAESINLRGNFHGDMKTEICRLLSDVGIPEPAQKIKAYPHELSGGMQQRAMIAMALAGNPKILVADEPTTALDVTIQAQILELLREIRKNTGMTIILVTHNLGIVAEMADRVVIMYAGHSVESADTRTILANPLHPYTQALLEAVPKLGHSKNEVLNTIKGNVPSPSNYPKGCRFIGRCPLAESLNTEDINRCAKIIPEWREIRKGHFCRCHFSK